MSLRLILLHQAACQCCSHSLWMVPSHGEGMKCLKQWTMEQWEWNNENGTMGMEQWKNETMSNGKMDIGYRTMDEKTTVIHIPYRKNSVYANFEGPVTRGDMTRLRDKSPCVTYLFLCNLTCRMNRRFPSYISPLLQSKA